MEELHTSFESQVTGAVSIDESGVHEQAQPDVAGVLQQARDRAAELKLPFAGGVTPTQAWTLFKSGVALLVDVRSGEERKFVGHVPESLHVAWATGTSLTRNPRFLRELEAKVKDKQAVVVLLCRSGKRSAAAAEVATKAGFKNVYNVTEGFEGEIDERGQRGKLGGWRFHDLPWKQD